MKLQDKIKRNRFAFEQLENRQLLTGNVNVDTSTGPAVITGDNSANVISITQTAPDTFKITGFGTTITGPKTFTTTEGIFIDMRGGNDSLTLKNMTINGDTGEIGLGIILGPGTDALVMSGVNVTYQTAISGGDKNAMVIDKCNFNCDLGIEGGEGVDAVTITRTNIDGALSIDLLDGTNALTMVTVNVSALDDGGGSYPYETLPPGFENLPDILPAEGTDCGAEIDGGSGVDAIAMVSVQIDCETDINTYGGVDSVAITNSRFGDALLPTAEVVTQVTPVSTDMEFSGLCIETGTGNDAVAINGTTVYGFLQIDTTGGYDCPTDEICDIASGAQPQGTEQTGKDGNDAVVLNNVKVLQSEEGLCLEQWCECCETTNPNIIANGIDNAPCWFQCCCDMSVLESGMLLIYTGNQVDSVALNKVTTDAEANIYTTDESSLDGADAVAITNSNFNQNNEVMECSVLPLVETGDGLYVETGNGNDAVTIAKVNVVGEAEIQTGAGTDAVAINALVADDIFVDLGSGKYDVLTIAKSVANTETFDGAGTTSGDTLVYKHLGNNFANPPDISGFQYVV